MKLYSTVMKEAQAEQVIEKSRFITHVKPVSSREEAEAFFKAKRKEYWNATHNVPAMVIGDHFQIQWGSDDGEPQGTSGAPIVQMLVQEGITNVAMVVTRYFGGIKLGTGGLVRAYTSSARIGLEAAGIGDVESMVALQCKIDYKGFNKVQSHSFDGKGSIEDTEYTDQVRFTFVCDPADEEWCRETLDGLTAGSLVIESSGEKLVCLPRE